MYKWKKIEKIIDGQKKEGVCPVIISASRATDIPAFHFEWFFRCLENGYIRWVNPFNNKESYVFFDETRVIVFWTKNPEPIIPYLKVLDERNIGYYFQFTLNDYEKEGFEPNVVKLEERIKTFKKLSEKIGKEKVIWRFDPLILTDQLSIDKLTEKIENIAKELKGYTEKLVFSYADIQIYSKVKNNLSKKNINYIEFDDEKKIEIAKKISEIGKKFNLEVATCAENIDLSIYGIKKNKCVDDELMVRLFKDDKKLMEFLGYDENLFSDYVENKKLKDKGQRADCGCIMSKDIGEYNTCMHLCVYCYANFSEEKVKENIKRLKQNY
jgi:DNA repair photolyase